MINKLITLTILYVCMTISYAQTQNLTLWDTQPGGLNTYEPSHTLNKTDFSDINNVYTDNGLYVNMREGLQTVWNSSAAPQNLYEYINLAGNRYLIVKSSQYLGYVDTDNTYKVLMATLPASARLWKVQYLNDCYIGTNQVTDRWQFDPTISNKLAISTFMPCGKYPVEAFDKVFMVNISTPLKGAAAVTINNDKSIVKYCAIGNLKSWDGTDGDKWLGISRNDGEDLTASFKYKGNVYVAKQHSVHQLLNVDDDEPDNDGSICVMPNIGVLGQDTVQEINGNMYWLSSDGVIEWSGTSYNIISNDIYSEIETLKQKNQSTSDSFTDTTLTDWMASTGVGVDSSTYSGSVILKAEDNQINQINNGTSDGDAGINTNFDRYQTFMTSYTLNISTVAIFGYKQSSLITYPLSIELQTASRVLIASVTILASNISASGLGSFIVADFSNFNITLTSGTIYYIVPKTTSSTSGYWWMFTTASSYSRGTGSGGGDFFFKVYQLLYKNGQFGSVLSQKRNIASWIQWSYLTANYEPTTTEESGYNIDWYVSVATDTAICGINYLTKVSTNMIIPSSNGGWVQWYASMTTTNVGISPKLNDVSIEYYRDSSINEEILTSYSDLRNIRYGIAGTKALLSKYNDVIYVFQIRNRKWTKFDIPARCFGKYNSRNYIGDSNGQGNINRFSYDFNTDNGTKINTMAKTPDYVLSTRANDCRFEELWTYAEPSVIYSSMTIQYYLNKNTVGFSTNTANVSLTATSGYEDMFIKTRMKAPIDRFRCIGFKVENFEKLYGLDFLFSFQPVGIR